MDAKHIPDFRDVGQGIKGQCTRKNPLERSIDMLEEQVVVLG